VTLIASESAAAASPDSAPPAAAAADGTDTPAAVSACLAAISGDAMAWEGVVARRINSRVHRARAGATLIAVKECFDPATLAPHPISAEREFAALSRIAESSVGCAHAALAPRPLSLCPEYGAYAMTWIPGRPVSDVLFSPPIVPGRASELGVAAGTWLRRFHALRPLPRRRNDFVAKRPYIRDILAASRTGDALLRRVAEKLLATAPSAAAVEMPASWIHGDMKCDNLLVHDAGMIGLDLQMNHENTVAYDIAPFLNHLFLLRWSARGFRRARDLRDVAHGFLQSYSADAGAWVLPVAWLRAYLLIQLIAPSPDASSLRTRIARWPVRRELARVAATLEAKG
jgi:aminoglycoside phosphotransferase (APT) family kinase protein